MDFTTIVLVVIVAAIAYTLFKAYSKKETIAEAVKEEVAAVVEVAEVVKVTATPTPAKKKPTVKKATTKTTTAKKKAPAKK